MTPTPTAALVAELCAQAARPPEEARTLAPELYHRPDVFALEAERIFRREWMCVGRVDQLAEPGDWLRVDLVGEPLVVVRDAAGALRALSRVCRHRAMDLLHGAARRGSAQRFECPYHLWSYALDGRLTGAPEMRGVRDFERAACGLPEFAVEIWQGYVFVNLDRAAAPLAPRMRELEAALGGVDMSSWRVAGSVAWGEIAVNWKIAIENGVECYHHSGTHRTSLQPLWPANTVVVDESSSAEFVLARMRVSEALAVGRNEGFPVQPTYLPPIPGLSARQRSETLVLGLFPMFFLAFGPDGATWFDWAPTGPESHRLDIHVVVPPESFAAPGFDVRLAAQLEAVRGIQAEDARTNAGVQAGLHARAAAPGRLSLLERPLWQFQRYLASRLADAS